MTERSAAQTATAPPSCPFRTKVKGVFLLTVHKTAAPHACRLCFFPMCEPERVLVPAFPVSAYVERGYITPQQVYNLLSAEEGQPALYDSYYILVLDCRSTERSVLHTCRLSRFCRVTRNQQTAVQRKAVHQQTKCGPASRCYFASVP